MPDLAFLVCGVAIPRHKRAKLGKSVHQRAEGGSANVACTQGRSSPYAPRCAVCTWTRDSSSAGVLRVGGAATYPTAPVPCNDRGNKPASSRRLAHNATPRVQPSLSAALPHHAAVYSHVSTPYGASAGGHAGPPAGELCAQGQKILGPGATGSPSLHRYGGGRRLELGVFERGDVPPTPPL